MRRTYSSKYRVVGIVRVLLVKQNSRLVASSSLVQVEEYVVMGVDVLARLHQQIQQVLVGLRDVQQPKAES